MAVPSRSRPRRNSDSSSASTRNSKTIAKTPTTQKDRRSLKQQQHSPPHPPPPRSHPTQTSHTSRTTPSYNDNDDEAGGRPAKRRKLSIRSKTQTTLDAFTTSGQSAGPKPPTRVTVAQPHGRLLQNLNGVQTILDANEDEISLPASGAATPKPKRVPKVQQVQPIEQTPATVRGKNEEKRTLRSQDDGPRLKSELSIYFPNYEEVIFDAPKEPEFITVDSTLYVTEDTAAAKAKAAEATPSPAKSGKKNVKGSSPSHARKTSATNGVLPPTSPTTPSKTSSNQFNGSPTLNLSMISRSLPAFPEDPLPDSHFLKAHRRAERKEKQLRNIEKERAMHEKVQLDRILEGLQGHDWLKVLGITGITDGEAKKFEPKRDYFVNEVKALVDKFKMWKEAERRLKVDKGTPGPVKEEDEEEVEESDGLDSGGSSVGPPSSDLNASAARQLQQETAIALKSHALTNSTATNSNPKPPLPPPVPEVPITSFYSKTHLRDAALGKSRHGRNVTAFGHPVPDLDVREFELPGDIVSEDAIRARAREKRRRRRESKVDGGEV